jgi:hypothetical protein
MSKLIGEPTAVGRWSRLFGVDDRNSRSHGILA